MYWKAAIVKYKYESERPVRVGIFLFETLTSEKPVLYVLGFLNCSVVKKKWRKPMKIKRWLLYDSHSNPHASRFLVKTVFGDPIEITEIGKKEFLYGFDKDIIAKKFPTMAKEVFWVIENKKKRK